MAREPKTRPTDASVGDFIAAVEPATRREDARAVVAMLCEITGEAPVMWGPSIIGFGSYRGATGDWPRSGFSPRQAELVLYLVPGFEQQSERMARLGKHRVGTSCLYIRKLADVDLGALRELLVWSHETMRERYPA